MTAILSRGTSLLLISMLWHRQAIYQSKEDRLSSSAECRAPRNKFQWNSNQSSTIFIQENTLEIVVNQHGGHFVQVETS